VSRYLITITPEGGAAGVDGAHTTVRVDTSTGRTRITELTVRSASGGGLAPTDLPAVDMELLIRALTPSGRAQPLAVEQSTLAPAGSSEPQAQPGASASAPPVAVEPRRRRKATGTATAPAKKATARKAAGRKATAGKAAAAKKATAAKTTKAASRRQPAAAAAPAVTAPRAYRRMPDPEQVMDVYRQTGSITGVAEHFGVPRHTVAGWARRLRGQGHTIGRA
jgi:hypothetical protein